MALDVFGNWVPPIIDPLPGEDPTGGPTLHGVGAPNDADGNNGQIYIDTSTGDLYIKSGDTWNIFAGGSGSATQVLGGADDPRGVLTASGRAIYVQDPDGDGMRNLYSKNTTGSNNTDWVLVTSFQS